MVVDKKQSEEADELERSKASRRTARSLVK